MTIVRVSVDASDALRMLTAATKQVDYATAVALTRTAAAVKAAERVEMTRVFVSAVPFTLNSLYIKAATRSEQVAVVGIKDQGNTSAVNWLLPEIEGGARTRGIEVFLRPANLPPPGMYAVPGTSAPMSGNKINITALKRIVSTLKAQPLGPSGFAGLNRKGKRRSNKAQYFALDKPAYGLPAGIYGVRGREVLPIIVFVKQPTYRKKFDFYGVATSTAQRVFPQMFRDALDAALASAR